MNLMKWRLWLLSWYRKSLHMRKVTVSRMRERYVQTVLTFQITYVQHIWYLHTLIPRAMQEKPRAELTMERREDMMRMGTPCMPHMVGMWLIRILGSASFASNTQPTDIDSRPRVTALTPRNRHCLQRKTLDTKTNYISTTSATVFIPVM